jgi:DNA-binding PadR family transcriptional regulator
LQKRIVKDFLDMVLLLELKKGLPKSGYDLTVMIGRRYEVSLSSGTIYSLLYALERDGLVEGRSTSRKRLYTLTPKGEETTADFLGMKKDVLDMLQKLFKTA